MALIDKKITVYVDNIVDLSDRPNENGITANQLKAMFDGRSDKELKTSLNGIVDDLVSKTDGASGADQVGSTALKSGGAETVQGQLEEVHGTLTSHTTNVSNPHTVTKTQVDLGNVDNVQQATKSEFNEFVARTDNPHGVTSEQVGAYSKTQVETSGSAAIHWGNLTNVPNLADDGWKAAVANQAALPTTGNGLGDQRVVLDDGDGKQAVYLCVAVTGTIDAQWDKIGDVDFAGDEATRVTQESARVIAEGLRVSAESSRTGVESARVSAESGRSSAEGLRVTAETNRGSAEGLRVTAETGRSNAEINRVSAEGLRVTAETGRSNAEIDRVTAEGLRVIAENSRNLFGDYVAETSYVVGNKVVYNGSSYICILASIGNLPTNETYWKLIAAKGLDGTGSGDMSKSVYDTNGNGIVDNAEKVNNLTVGTAVPEGALFTDTVYTHPASHPASMITDLPTGKKVARFTIGTSTAGWTSADCDYLCDGTADQTEINAAITALPATGGEIVILDGTYNITAKIDVTKNNVSIRGNGNATILKRMFNSSVKEGVITLTSRSGCKIANLQIEGNKTSYTNINNYGIYLDASSNENIITGNTCNNNSRGIYLSSSSNNTITGNTCNNNSSRGIYLYSSSNENIITGNTCNNNNTYAIYLDASSNTTVTGNTCNNNDYGISLGASSNDNTITVNTCNNNSRGIYLYSSSNTTITGNTCNNNSSYGIYLYLSSNENTVTGNACNNNNYGIYLNASSNTTVTGNTCNNNSSYGIYLYSSSNNNTITGNTFIRGTGLSTDYTVSQHTIQIKGTDNNYNLIAMNNCMGKAVTNEGGTGNTLVNNKYNAT